MWKPIVAYPYGDMFVPIVTMIVVVAKMMCFTFSPYLFIDNKPL